MFFSATAALKSQNRTPGLEGVGMVSEVVSV